LGRQLLLVKQRSPFEQQNHTSARRIRGSGSIYVDANQPGFVPSRLGRLGKLGKLGKRLWERPVGLGGGVSRTAYDD
jgi:hypothetical protein